MSTVATAAERFAAGEPVLVGDRPDEPAFVVAAADTIVPEQLERLQELGRGIVVLGVGESIAERLGLPASGQAADRRTKLRLTTPIDAATGIGGGWSLQDRARTMRVAASPDSGPEDVITPGHVVAACVSEHAADAASAAIELARLSGRALAVVLCSVLEPAGLTAGFNAARGETGLARLEFASSGELHSHVIGRTAQELAIACGLPTRAGAFRAIGFGLSDHEPATVALVHGDPAAAARPLVHVHVACRLGDSLGSLLCDCRAQLDRAIAEIVAEGCGVIIYSQLEQTAGLACPRKEPIDVSLAAGLLRAAGVMRLRPSLRALSIRDALRDRGLEVVA
jgi:3,4-dihydroxy 2-butanone 4-phosphate synthase / GTP cyclohydrolase II